MFILGLTGSIGMGKSATADMFRMEGIPVHDADASVHQLMGPSGRAIDKINQVFPNCLTEEGAVDRQKLGTKVFGNDQALKKLEAILHPMVRSEEKRFLRTHQLRRADMVVLDIPLLYETYGEKRCDAVCVVSASKTIQAKRVLARAGMTQEKFQAIIKKQIPNQEKCQRADFIVFTASGYRTARNQVKKIIRQVKG